MLLLSKDTLLLSKGVRLLSKGVWLLSTLMRRLSIRTGLGF